MEKMLTLTQDQFAALLKRELTTTEAPPASDALGSLPKREAYRYATVCGEGVTGGSAPRPGQARR